MTLLHATTLLTTLSVVLVLLLSIAARVRFRQTFFGFWIWAHVWELVTMLIDLASKAGGRHPALILVLAGSIWLSLWYVGQTARSLNHRPWPAIGMWGGLAVCVGLTGLCVAMGWSYVPAMMPMFLLIPLALGWLGITILRKVGRDWKTHAVWLGFPLMGRAAYGIVMLGIIGTVWEWIFLGIGALLHVVTGIGMVLYLALDTLDRLDEKNVALAAANQDLRTLDRLKDEFLATMSHELRTPLTAIKGGVELLEMGQLGDEDRRRFLTLVHDHTLHLEQMVSDLLDVSRLRAGEMTYDLEVGDLSIVVLEALNERRPEFEARGLTLATELSEAPMPVWHDVRRMHQVLRHLLSNAAKFTPSGGRVTVRAWVQDDEVRVTVCDTGIGIRPEDQDRIFQLFYQADNSATRNFGGAGLGLAICRAIVQDGHGGRLAVTSTPGQGSTFLVVLALAQSDESERAA